MKDHQYHLMTVKDVHRDTKAIVVILKAIMEGELSNDLRLLNYFREIPVSYGAVVISMDDDFVELDVHQNQAVVMHDSNITFLKSSHFPHDVIANVFKVNIEKSIAFLTKFSYVQIRAERRRFVRVKVEEPLSASFRGGGKMVVGRLFDISITGLSLETKQQVDIEPESEGSLYISLPTGRLEVPGKLIKFFKEEERLHYIFEMETDNKTESLISQFIFQKQVEIIRELKDQIN